MRVRLFSLLLVVALHCQASEFGKPIRSVRAGPLLVETSLIALLGNPKEWNERVVSVIGFIAPDHHGVLLYASSEFCKAGAEQYSVQIVLDSIEPPIQWHQLPKQRCQLATVQGRFLEQPKQFEQPEEVAADTSVIETIVLRDRPGLIEAQYVGYND